MAKEGPRSLHEIARRHGLRLSEARGILQDMYAAGVLVKEPEKYSVREEEEKEMRR